MRCHDFHLSGYTVSKFGAEIVLHLVTPLEEAEESHIRFSDVDLYHFIHTGGTIIFDITEIPLAQILDQFWDRILEWERQYGGIGHLDRDDRTTYQAKLEADSYKAWDISSSVGFAGFVIARSIEDVTREHTRTAARG
jgi:hypothetical protein